MPRRIYLASSWRNRHYFGVRDALRAAGHEVYDFRNPAPGNTGFAWSEIDPGWQEWSLHGYRESLDHPIARAGFALDKAALDWCDTCVLALPCGRSAHLELGYAAGQGKETFVLLHEDKFEPELMYLLNDDVFTSLDPLLAALSYPARPSFAAFVDQVERWYAGQVPTPAPTAAHAVRTVTEAVEHAIEAGATQAQIAEAVGDEFAKATGRGDWGGNPAAVPDEAGDVLIRLIIDAKVYGFDLLKAAMAKFDRVRRYDMRATPDGVLYRRRYAADELGGADLIPAANAVRPAAE